MLEGIFEFC